MQSASTLSGAAEAGSAEAFFIGLISGTSVDGIDAALVSFAPTLRLVHAFTMPMADDLAADILRVSQADALVSLDFLGQLDTRVARAFAQAANLLVERSGVERASVFAVGSHGQTLRHQPRGDAPFSLQVGDGNVIAERCGITRSPISGAVTSLPVARARRWCRPSMPRSSATPWNRARS